MFQDEQGVVTASFGKPIRGHRDFIYLDKDHQVFLVPALLVQHEWPKYKGGGGWGDVCTAKL